MLNVIDHTATRWAQKYRNSGRENGAATYSREIVQHHVPAWRERLNALGYSRVTLSTAPPLLRNTDTGELVIQYLHAYPYENPTGRAEQVARMVAPRFPRALFVTAYRSLATKLTEIGLEAMYLPMTVDVQAVAEHRVEVEQRIRGAVYFGNVTEPKRAEHHAMAAALERAGLPVDTISENVYRGQRVTQHEAWAIASQYTVGVGVGRCALELLALGLPVIVSGAQFGGIVTTEAEHAVQSATNWNGRVVTFDRERSRCVESFGASLVRSCDVSVAVDMIRQADLRAAR